MTDIQKILLCLRFGSPNLRLLLHLPEVEHSLPWFFLYLLSVFKSILKTLAPCCPLNYHGLFIIASADLYHLWAISLLAGPASGLYVTEFIAYFYLWKICMYILFVCVNLHVERAVNVIRNDSLTGTKESQS